MPKKSNFLKKHKFMLLLGFVGIIYGAFFGYFLGKSIGVNNNAFILIIALSVIGLLISIALILSTKNGN